MLKFRWIPDLHRWHWFLAKVCHWGKSVNFRTLPIVNDICPAAHTQETLFTVVPTVLSLSHSLKSLFDIFPGYRYSPHKVSIGNLMWQCLVLYCRYDEDELFIIFNLFLSFTTKSLIPKDNSIFINIFDE